MQLVILVDRSYIHFNASKGTPLNRAQRAYKFFPSPRTANNQI